MKVDIVLCTHLVIDCHVIVYEACIECETFVWLS